MIEPNCDMPWDIYLDWLQDQGNEDLRDIDEGYLIGSQTMDSFGYGWSNNSWGVGVPANFNFSYGNEYYVGHEFFNYHSGCGIVDEYHGSDGNGLGSAHCNPVFEDQDEYAYGSG